MNWRPIFQFRDGTWAGNAQVFATKEEALGSAKARFKVWTMPTDYAAEVTAEAVTYMWHEHTGDVPITHRNGSVSSDHQPNGEPTYEDERTGTGPIQRDCGGAQHSHSA